MTSGSGRTVLSWRIDPEDGELTGLGLGGRAVLDAALGGGGLWVVLGEQDGPNSVPLAPGLPDVVRTAQGFVVPGTRERSDAPVRVVGGDGGWRLTDLEVVDAGDAELVRVRRERDGLRVTEEYTVSRSLPVVRYDLTVVPPPDELPLLYVLKRFPASPRPPVDAPGQELEALVGTDQGNFVPMFLAGGAVSTAWALSDGDHHRVFTTAQDTAGTACAWNMVAFAGARPGTATRTGSFQLAVAPDLRNLGLAVQEWYVTGGIHALPDPPSWGPRCHVYETFVGDWPMDGLGNAYAPHPTVGDLVADLERIAGLGFDVLYLMPRHPFPSYTTAAFEDFGLQYGDGPGTEKAIAELTAAAAAHGIAVIADVVLHGVLDREALGVQARRRDSEQGRDDLESIEVAWTRYERAHLESWEGEVPDVHPYWIDHPEWFAQLPGGEAQFTYTRAFDLRSPGLQRFIVAQLVRGMAELGLSGYRFDAPTWNRYCYQWSPEAGYRPSWAMGGAKQLLPLFHLESRRRGLSPLMFVETADAQLARFAHLRYPYDEVQTLRAAVTQALPGADVMDALAYLARVQVPGAGLVAWADSHDSAWWFPEGSKFAAERHGPEAARALFSLCALRAPAVMCFAGGERGLEDDVRALLSLRRRDAVLRDGLPQWDAVTVQDRRVAGLLWRAPFGGARLCLWNLSAEAVRTSVVVGGVEEPVPLLALGTAGVTRTPDGLVADLGPWACLVLDTGGTGGAQGS